MWKSRGSHVNLKCWMESKIGLCTKTITVPRLDNYASSCHSFSLPLRTWQTSQCVEKDKVSWITFPWKLLDCPLCSEGWWIWAVAEILYWKWLILHSQCAFWFSGGSVKHMITSHQWNNIVWWYFGKDFVDVNQNHKKRMLSLSCGM
jgi:hypothetical protein